MHQQGKFTVAFCGWLDEELGKIQTLAAQISFLSKVNTPGDGLTFQRTGEFTMKDGVATVQAAGGLDVGAVSSDDLLAPGSEPQSTQ